MIAASVAAVCIAALAHDAWRRTLASRKHWQEERVKACETQLEGLANTGKVLSGMATRITALERAVKAALVE